MLYVFDAHSAVGIRDADGPDKFIGRFKVVDCALRREQPCTTGSLALFRGVCTYYSMVPAYSDPIMQEDERMVKLHVYKVTRSSLPRNTKGVNIYACLYIRIH